MKSTWEWLGISPTTDKNAIKTAYANQVKKYHPEEHPQEAQELRKAYKAAMAQAKTGSGGKKSSFAKTLEQPVFQFTSKPATLKDNEKELDKSGFITDNKFEYRWKKPEGVQKVSQENSEEKYAYEWQQRAKEEALPPKKKVEVPKKPVRVTNAGPRKEVDWNGAGASKANTFSYNLNADGDLDKEQKERLDTFFKYYKVVYGDKDLCRNSKAWRMIFKNFQKSTDYKNPDYVGAIIEELTKTNRIQPGIWRLIERRLFRYATKEAEWLVLRDRFQVAKNGTSKQSIAAAYGNTTPKTMTKSQVVEKIYADNKTFATGCSIRYALTDACIMTLICGVFVVSILAIAMYKPNQNSTADKRKPVVVSKDNTNKVSSDKNDIEEIYLSRFGLEPTDHDRTNKEYTTLSLITKRTVLEKRKAYVIETPYKYIDADGDGTGDVIYYDPLEGKYKISYSEDPQTEFYYLKEYKDAHPEWAEKNSSTLKYLIDGES